ncbi:biliverdin-producing heme oxygenase [Cellulomonas chengniuliangii]|uniref:biliverdin-producing heme oxygenase n=1 Tax=Cellulomonas chengniuliangii TaxID=2968084 RepID=UPI001D0E58E8|nr:biliverdin-producing heme oxygenase [Cellulomonas chengniuliangii]MCC2318591.1 biliverdin-producing heme oxygenase [Cellulomonas chengniuliangii]
MTTTTHSPAVEQAATTTPLSTLLREGTRPEHEAAEQMGFVEQLMAGHLDRAAYTDLAVQQHAIYTALEAASAEIRAQPGGETIVFDELTRVPSIEADLAFLLGPDWAQQMRVLPATERYAARLRETGSSIALYVAHAYTRYLGDLSGGQIIQRMLERHYGFGAEGVSFYHFAQIPKAKPFKDAYRERLDALDLDEDQRATAVAEAKRAFEHNRALFAELGALHLR